MLTNMMDCIKGIVGITRDTSCDCAFNGATPEEIEEMTTSKSGLFLDEISGGISLATAQAAGDCRTLAKLMLQQMRIAELATENAIRMSLSAIYDQRKGKYTGSIGEYTFVKPLPIGGNFVGIKLQAASKDGLIKLNRVSLILEQAATTDVYLIKAHKGAQIGHIVHKWEDITTAPRMIVNLPPILNTVFPTYDNNASVDYYILWDREKAGIVSPMDNKVSCGCGDKDSKIQQFVIPYGVNFQNLHSINTPGNKTEYANGVILDVEMTCGTSQFFCREFDEKDEIAIAVASAVQYYAASGLLDRVLTTPNINRFTMENNQTLENMRAEYISEFKKLIQFIQNVADITGTDCFICKSSITDINITGIIS